MSDEQAMQTVSETAMMAITPLGMLQQAVTSGADISILERLMDLQERWQKNEARRAFTAALSRVRADMPEIVKSRTVDFSSGKGRTNYKYEDLAEVIEAVSPVLGRHGLSFRWRTDSAGGKTIAVTCILEHSDGHAEETTLAGPIDESGNKNAVQAIGSVVTYLQRYTLKASLGIAAGADDDGRQGAKPGEPARQDTGHRAGATSEQIALIRKLYKSHVITDQERAGIEKRLDAGTLNGHDCIEWLKTIINERKTTEKDTEVPPTEKEDKPSAKKELADYNKNLLAHLKRSPHLKGGEIVQVDEAIQSGDEGVIGQMLQDVRTLIQERSNAAEGPETATGGTNGDGTGEEAGEGEA